MPTSPKKPKLHERLVEIFTDHKDWRGVIGYDDFAKRPVFLKQPTAKGSRLLKRYSGASNEIFGMDVGLAKSWLERTYKTTYSRRAVARAMSASAAAHSVHPVRKMLHAVPWDGWGRIDSLLPEYFGAEDNPAVRRLGRWWIISAVARIMKPGCTTDHMLVLGGAQGTGKSSGLRALAEPWFSEDTEIDLNPLHLRGVWIAEVPEVERLDGRQGLAKACAAGKLGNGDSLLIGTTNNALLIGTARTQSPLGRRFVVVPTGNVHVERIRADRAQLWAEALALYNAGAAWYPIAFNRSLHSQPKGPFR